MNKLAKTFINCFNTGGKVIAIGCGGSDAEASHFAGELLCKIKKWRKPLPAITINNPTIMTAIANDISFDLVYSRQLQALGKKEDILITFSTSGKSQVIINAIEEAKRMEVTVVEAPRIGANTQAIQTYQQEWMHELALQIENHYV